MAAVAAQDTLGRLRAARLAARDERAFSGRTTKTMLDTLVQETRRACTVPDPPHAAVALFAAAVEEQRASLAQDLETRRKADSGLSEALHRLRLLSTSGEMSRRAPAELREAGGFTRVMISSARGSRWLPDTMRREDRADPLAEDFERFARDGNEIPLGRMMLETEMVRHRVSVIVEDAETDPRTYKPLIRVTQSRSYVAAPIATNRRVIGFLHGDRLGQRSSVTTGDLATIQWFAAEFGVLFECAVLKERMEGQRARATDLLSSMSTTLSTLAEEPLTLHFGTGGPLAPGRDPGVQDTPPERLSRRELEVLTLLSAGATNRAIAQELVLSAETVKSHVANVMRKLRASTRAEAAAKHLHSRASAAERKPP